MPLARSCVERFGDLVALGLCQVLEASSLGQILADEPVEVLVAAAFPGVVRGREVAAQLGASLQQLVVVELSTVVESDGLEGAGLPFDDGLHRGGGLRLVARIELANDRVAGFAFHHRQQAVRGAMAHDGVGFPVADSTPCLDDRGSLGDVALSQQDGKRPPVSP